MKHKIAIVGFGGIGNWHDNVIEKIENLAVAGIWDIDSKRREFASDKGLHVYESLEDLLADDTTNIVLVSTPNDSHKDLAIAAMRAGKNVIVEKPVALNSAELKEMIEVSEATGKLFTVHQNRRWDEDFLIVCDILESGKLGEVFDIQTRVHGSRGIPHNWLKYPENGGGMVLDWGVHVLDQILMMFPGEQIKTVYASLTHVTNTLVDDGFRVELTISNGIRVLAEVGTNNFVPLPRWYVLGCNGTAVIEDFDKQGKMIVATGESEKDIVPVVTAAGITKTMAPRREDTIKELPLPDIKADHKEFYHNVLATIEGKAESLIKLSEVARSMKLMEAVFESARKNEVIHFE